VSLSALREWNARTQRAPFPVCFDKLVRAGGLLAAGGALYVPLLVAFAASPKTTDVGYAPEQPIPYSHELHVGQLGLDCRYCHTSVEVGPKANIPPTQTCMNCHSKILTESDQLEPLRSSFRTGLSVEWIRVHDLPDYAFFNHSAHVTRGIGCVSCHGRVDQMTVVTQVEPLSMAWCVDCHRHPDENLRPPEYATDMEWRPTVRDGKRLDREVPEDLRVGEWEPLDPNWNASGNADRNTQPVDPQVYGALFKIARDVAPPTDCSTCHR